MGQQYCTAPCVTGADCPNGYGCQPVGSPATNVCVKAEAACSAGDTVKCIAPAACDSSPAMIVSSCTLACNTAADCPVRAIGLPAWTCDGAGICRRPPDVYGPLATGERASYYCNSGGTVVNEANETVGRIDELLIGADGRTPYAVLSVGGFLGLGDRLVVVPYESLKMAANKIMLPGATREALKALPEFRYARG